MFGLVEGGRINVAAKVLSATNLRTSTDLRSEKLTFCAIAHWVSSCYFLHK